MSFYFTNKGNNKFTDVDLLHKLGCKLCPLYNVTSNKNKDIQPQGSLKPSGIYILGQGPGDQEDKLGKFFIGPAGRELKSYFTEFQWSMFRVNNVTRTRTPDDATPVFEAVECCRPSIEADIALVKPKAIFALGGVALNWFIRGASIDAWRGHHFPAKILDHTCWVFPFHHPSHLLRNPFLKPTFRLDVAAAYEFLKREIKPEVEDPKKAFDSVLCLTKLDDILSGLERLGQAKLTVTDLETHRERPYYSDSLLLTWAIGTATDNISFPYKHPKFNWKPEEFARLKEALYNFYCSGKLNYAHNTPFELEWLAEEFGSDIVRKSPWRDTMAAAYVLNYGGNEKKQGSNSSEEDEAKLMRGLLSLDNLSLAYLGLPLKSLSNLNIVKLISEPLDKVLKYNGGDTCTTAKIVPKIEADIEYESLQQQYVDQCSRIPTVVLAQRIGLPYNAELAKTYYNDFDTKVADLARKTIQLPEITEYQTRFGKFDLNAPKDVANLLKYLGFDVYIKGEDDKPKLSSDESVLKKIDHPIARNVLQIRELLKVKNTYLQPFVDRSIIFPDNRIHTQFTTCFTTSRRFSSIDPNIQNFPKRKNKQIRRIIVPPKGFILSSNDYGQIEARVIAMASKDKNFVNALWKGLDIHADWAKILATMYPKRVGGNLDKFLGNKALFKTFRDIVKNKFVFPSFFDASVKALSGYMDMPYDVIKEAHELFWGPKHFSGIREWQEAQKEFYKTHGYVESLTGFRRYRYIQGGEIVNFAIQSTAADIMVDSMNRLSEYAMETGKSQFQAAISLHDDLSFFLPIDSWKEDVITIAKMMLDCPFDFVNVPLSVESSTGTNWGELLEVGTFSSDKPENLKITERVPFIYYGTAN